MRVIFIRFDTSKHNQMKVFLNEQAQDLLIKDKIPVNSIGVCKSNEGWAYWYWDGSIFDSGVKSTEAEALATAKANFNSTFNQQTK